MKHTRRSGMSLIEIIIGMSIALVITGVLFFVFFNTQKNAERGMDTLNYIRKATILLEQLKQDIRASTPKTGSIKASGTTATIERYSGDKVVSVSYKFDPQEHAVTRTAPDGTKTYGADGKLGNIVFFNVNPVKDMPGFFKIEVKFQTFGQIQANPNGTPDNTPPDPSASPDKRANHNYEFQTLVNKRAAEDTDKDIQWHYAYDQ